MGRQLAARRRVWGWFGVWVALSIAAGGWLSTLQRDIGAADDPSPAALGIVGPLMDDSGEFVIAWHTWGVSHPPGYPLLNLLGNLATPVLNSLAPTPAAAAGLVSLAFNLAALALLARLVWLGSDSHLGAALAGLLPAWGGLIWLYASVAEVYGLGLLLAGACLWAAVRVGHRPTVAGVLLLGGLFGLALGHHRTLALLGPALAYAAWPARRVGWRPWVAAAGLALSSLIVYVYLPLTTWAGSPWVYGRAPTTWVGLADALLAREYGAQLALRLDSWGTVAFLLAGRWGYLAQEMTPPAALAGLAGLGAALAWGSARLHAVAVVLALVVAGYFLAPVSQLLLIGTHLPIMLASLALGGAWGLGAAAVVARRRWPGLVVLAVTAVLMLGIWRAHRPIVLGYTRDPMGRQIINAVQSLADPAPTVVAIWGPRYFALAYGRLVTRELPQVKLLNSWANLANLPPPAALPPVIYTVPALLNVAGLSQWESWRGGPVYLESAGDGLVAVRSAPRLAPPVDAGEDEVIPLDAHAWLTDASTVRLTLEWLAQRAPTQDYHVFVHVTDQARIEQATDIIAQGDQAHPVYGFYPTSDWLAGQPVRDDYRVTLPSGRQPRQVVFGLYTQTPDGRFINHVVRSVPLDSPR